MRRPHPRFEQARNAWVTRAGGKLKILAEDPKNGASESAARDVFFMHMARLGQAVETAIPVITLGQLADKYGEWMQREIAAQRLKPKTFAYYHRELQKFLDTVGGNRAASCVLPLELEMYKTNWHSVQTVQRLYNWAVEVGLLAANPLRSAQKPELGQRQRILSPIETVRLLRAVDRHFRSFLLAIRYTIARPQEVRALQLMHLAYEPVPVFVLRDFTARSRREDKKNAIRVIPPDERVVRLLNRLTRRCQPSPEAFVFLNRHGVPWTANAVRCRMRRLREKLRLVPDEYGENVVAYTLRHTAATRASSRGVRDKVLAELMGHTNTATTQRYQHLQADHLAEAVKQPNSRKVQYEKNLFFPPVVVSGRGSGCVGCRC